jgi:small subunit ribosomal protein S15
LDKVRRSSVIEEHRAHEKDTGSTEVQIALLSARITELTDHVRVHHHDYSTRRGLMKLVGRRRRLLKYLGASDINRYRTLLERLGLRR